MGGGELAAYNLFRSYRTHPDVDAAFFLAHHKSGHGTTGRISPRRPDEYLWDQTVRDWFLMKAANRDALGADFADLIRHLKPSVVHINHYVQLGLEYIKFIKRIDPSIKIILTLHEFVAICLNRGKMIKTADDRLCFQETPMDCSRCFPEHEPESFWLRKRRYMSYFEDVDQFVAPSEFLRQRYIDWGIAPERIVTIENGQVRRDPLTPRPLPEGGTRNRFGFFGQISPFKGLHMLLQALSTLPESERRRLVLEVHGTNLGGQPEDFQEMIRALRGPLEREGVLEWGGPYEPFQLAHRMAGVDWVVVPSLWWENSPMVIQEAFTFGRPVVGADIGGMAEKITDGVNGVHVAVGNRKAWSQALLQLATDGGAWDRLRAGIRPPLSHAECADAHLRLLDPA